MIEITQEMIDIAGESGIDIDSFDSSLHDWILKSYITKEAQQQQVTDENGDPVTDENGNPIFETIYVDVVRHKITGFSAKAPIIVELTKYSTANESVTVNGYPAEPINSVYQKPVSGDSLTLEADIVDDNGNVITAIDSLVNLRLPIQKILNQSTLADEDYLDTTIAAGHIVAVGQFKSGGTWVLNEERINASLDEINAGWHISLNPMTFWVAGAKQV